MTKKSIVEVEIERIHPHPENPRKQLGDLQELAESIKAQGILQNLTIVPIKEQPGEYYALIGNRRHAAAKLAGLKVVPCNIEPNLSKAQQQGIMLIENTLRDDLTVTEQAQSFQMMLDLGETVESLSQKTGLSKTTIQHRINISKLDQKLLIEKEADESFQLNLTDLFALEKLPLTKRNKLLKEASDSKELKWKIEYTVAQENRKQRAKKIINLLRPLGLEPAPDNAENEIYTSKWTTITKFELDKEVPKKEDLKFELSEPIYYLIRSREICIIKKSKKKVNVLSPTELKEKQIQMRRKQIKTIEKEMAAIRKEFIQNIISGKIKPLKEKESKHAEKLIWQVLVSSQAYISMALLTPFVTFKENYKLTDEEYVTAKAKVEKLSLIHQMLMTIPSATNNLTLTNTDGSFNKKISDILTTLYNVLKLYGLSLNNEEKQVLNGSHEYYKKEEKVA